MAIGRAVGDFFGVTDESQLGGPNSPGWNQVAQMRAEVRCWNYKCMADCYIQSYCTGNWICLVSMETIVLPGYLHVRVISMASRTTFLDSKHIANCSDFKWLLMKCQNHKEAVGYTWVCVFKTFSITYYAWVVISLSHTWHTHTHSIHTHTEWTSGIWNSQT